MIFKNILCLPNIICVGQKDEQQKILGVEVLAAQKSSQTLNTKHCYNQNRFWETFDYFRIL